jgi:tetratricopeptide (TPR) repeat protein
MQPVGDPDNRPLPLPQWRTDVAVTPPQAVNLGLDPRLLSYALETNPDRFEQLWRLGVADHDVLLLQQLGALAASELGGVQLAQQVREQIVVVGVLAATRVPDDLEGFGWPLMQDLGTALETLGFELELAGRREGAKDLLDELPFTLGEAWSVFNELTGARGGLVRILKEIVDLGAVGWACAVVDALDAEGGHVELVLQLAPKLRDERYGSAAERLLTRALERHGPRADLLRCRAATRRQLGASDLAESDAYEALALDPQDPRSVNTLRPLVRLRGQLELLELLERLAKLQLGATLELGELQARLSGEQTGLMRHTRELLELAAQILSGAGRTDLAAKMLDDWRED